MPFRLSVEDGRFARTLDVRTPTLAVGSAAVAALRLDAPGVARDHVVVRQLGTRLAFECRSRGATIVVRGRVVHRAVVGAGDVVRVGEARIRIDGVEPMPPLPAGAQPERPVARKRARTLPWAASAAVHAVAFLVLQSLVMFGIGAQQDAARVVVDAPEAPIEIADVPEELPVEDPLEHVVREAPEIEMLPPEPELPDVPLSDSDPNLKRIEPRPRAPAEDRPPPAPAQSVIGVGASQSAVPDLGAKSFDKGSAAAANRTSAGLLESDAAGGAVLRGVRARATKDSVWVVTGGYDHAERVLRDLTVDCALLERDGLETRELPDSLRVIVYNCTGRPLSAEAQRRVAWWVWNGGWLVTTDWGVERILERGMPGTLTPLRENDRPVLTRDETVGVRATTDRGLAAGVPPGSDARWWLEDSSVPFTVADGLDAEVLVRSDELERRHGHGASGVAVTFAYGKGRVLHMLGHIYQQEGNVRGALIVHRILVNFLGAALAR